MQDVLILQVMSEIEKLRIDKYLWAIRLFKTRSQAGDACDKGKIKMNGDACKASRQVIAGDEYDVKTEQKRWRIKVTGLLYKRVQYAEAIKVLDTALVVAKNRNLLSQILRVYDLKSKIYAKFGI